MPITSSEAHLKYELHLKYTMCLYKTKPWWHTFAILWLFIVNLLWITILGTFRFQFFNVNSSIFCDVCTYLLLSFLLRSLRSLLKLSWVKEICSTLAMHIFFSELILLSRDERGMYYFLISIFFLSLVYIVALLVYLIRKR